MNITLNADSRNYESLHFAVYRLYFFFKYLYNSSKQVVLPFAVK